MTPSSPGPAAAVIVADASLVCEALAEPGGARDALLDDAVAVPDLIDAEVGNALRGAVIRGEVPAEIAAGWLRSWSGFAVRRHDAVPLLGRVWELRHAMTAYDAFYVALAEALECPLVTLGRQARARLGAPLPDPDGRSAVTRSAARARSRVARPRRGRGVRRGPVGRRPDP